MFIYTSEQERETDICVYRYVYIYIYMYTCMYIRIYIYMYTYVCIYTDLKPKISHPSDLHSAPPIPKVRPDSSSQPSILSPNPQGQVRLPPSAPVLQSPMVVQIPALSPPFRSPDPQGQTPALSPPYCLPNRGPCGPS